MKKLPVAFLAAILVLLVMPVLLVVPLLVATGFGAFGLAPEVPSSIDSTVVLTGFAIWVVLIVTLVGVLVSVWLRRTARGTEH